jgi:hypothetical protein
METPELLDDESVEPLPVVPWLDAEGRAKIIEVRFVVEEDFHGWRLDHYLKRKIRRLSRTKIQEIIASQLELARGARSPGDGCAPACRWPRVTGC